MLFSVLRSHHLEMKAIRRLVSRPDGVFRTYKKKMIEYIRSQDAAGALQCYREIKEARVQSSTKNTTSFLLSLCYEHKNYTIAKEIFRDCLKVPDNSYSHCEALESIFPIMIRFAADEKDFNLCMGMLQIMEQLDIPLKGRTMSPIVSALLAANTVEHTHTALALMLNMLKRGLIPRHEDFAELFIIACKLHLFDNHLFLSRYRLLLHSFGLLERSVRIEQLKRMAQQSGDRAVLAAAKVDNMCTHCNHTIQLYNISNDEAARLYVALRDIVISCHSSFSAVEVHC